MTTETVETIAEKMRQAAKKGIRAWLNVVTDSVDVYEMIHNPATPMDGPTTQAQARKINDGAADGFERVFPNGHTVTGPVTIKGDDITTDFTLSGVLADGTPVSFSSLTSWTVKDGHIVACYANSQLSKEANPGRDAMMKALAEARA